MAFQRRTSKCEQPSVNSELRSDISVEVLQQLSKARPPGAYFLSASLQQLAEMSCLGREANAAALVSSPSNPAAPPPATTTTTTPVHPAQWHLALDSLSNIFHIPFQLRLIGNLESLYVSFLSWFFSPVFFPLCSPSSHLSGCLIFSVSSWYERQTVN